MNVKELFYSPDFLNKRTWQLRYRGVALDWQSQSRVPTGHSGGGQWTATESWTPVSKMKHVKSLGGTTGAELYEDEKGRKFVVKKGASEEHAKNEYEANRFYDKLGVSVPESQLHLMDGKQVLVTRFIEGKQFNELTPAEQALAREKIKKDFAADALMGNWDVTGANGDNIIVDKYGTPWRIDNGGAMSFRAQGASKGSLWNEKVDELVSMREKGPAGQMFKGLTNKDVENQVDHLVSKSPMLGSNAMLDERLERLKMMTGDEKAWPWADVSSTASIDSAYDSYKSLHDKISMPLKKAGLSSHQIEQVALANSLKPSSTHVLVSKDWHPDAHSKIAAQFPGKEIKATKLGPIIKKQLGSTATQVKIAKKQGNVASIFSVTKEEKAIAVKMATTTAEKKAAEALNIKDAENAVWEPSMNHGIWKRPAIGNGSHIPKHTNKGNWAEIKEKVDPAFAKMTSIEKEAISTWKGQSATTREAMVTGALENKDLKVYHADQARHFASAVDKCPKFEGVVFRGVGHVTPGTKYYAAMQKLGNVIEFEAHACSSRRSSLSFGGGVCLMRIAQKNGGAIETSGEDEIVLKRGTRYKVVGVAHNITVERYSKKSPVALFVDLEEVQDEPHEKLALSFRPRRSS